MFICGQAQVFKKINKPIRYSPIKSITRNQFYPYEKAEKEFVALLNDEDLDAKLSIEPHAAENFNEKIDDVLVKAFSDEDESAHLFIQRCLYRINRLKLFWYDDLNNYSNENSRFLFDLRTKIEKQWSVWEDDQIQTDSLKTRDVFQALCDRADEDLSPDLTEDGRYIRDHISEVGYRQLLSIGSLDGLVEASQL
ncbi:MAG: iron-containing redox enzyme family protein, partial [Nitrospinae bacterium]|nr:iron-containing redox enzyme family protein [Nitrospinota bacterium]